MPRSKKHSKKVRVFIRDPDAFDAKEAKAMVAEIKKNKTRSRTPDSLKADYANMEKINALGGQRKRRRTKKRGFFW
jgi:hypothetical protein